VRAAQPVMTLQSWAEHTHRPPAWPVHTKPFPVGKTFKPCPSYAPEPSGVIYPGTVSPGAEPTKLDPKKRKYGRLGMRCRSTLDLTFTGLPVDARVHRGLRFPQLHQTDGEHDRRGINLFLPRQHVQKCDSLG